MHPYLQHTAYNIPTLIFLFICVYTDGCIFVCITCSFINVCMCNSIILKDNEKSRNDKHNDNVIIIDYNNFYFICVEFFFENTRNFRVTDFLIFVRKLKFIAFRNTRFSIGWIWLIGKLWSLHFRMRFINYILYEKK